jgi:hypothetical protein
MPTYEAVFPGPGTTADVRLRLDLTPGTGNVALNKTPLAYSAYLYKASSGGTPFNNNSQTDVVCVINGSTVIDLGSFNYSFASPNNAAGATFGIGSGTIDVTHDPDGRKTVTFSLSFNDLPSDVIGDTSLSGSLVLTPIPRGAKVRLAAVWKQALAWIRVLGIWKQAIPWVKTGGVWKRSS